MSSTCRGGSLNINGISGLRQNDSPNDRSSSYRIRYSFPDGVHTAVHHLDEGHSEPEQTMLPLLHLSTSRPGFICRLAASSTLKCSHPWQVHS